MKRFFTAMVLSAAFLLTSCASKATMESTESIVNSPFECDMKMIFEDQEFGGKLRKTDIGVYEADFTSPDTLEGVILSFNGNDVTASYKGLSFTVPKKALPVKSALLNFFSVVDNLAQSDKIEGTEKDGVIFINGENESGEYSLECDSKECDIDSFKMKNFGVRMEFENFTPVENKENVGEAVSEAPAEVTETVS